MEQSKDTVVVVKLGKSSRKRIKKLKRGEGNLMDELQTKLAKLKAAGEISETAEPVVFIVERRSEMSMPMPMSMSMPKFFSMKRMFK